MSKRKSLSKRPVSKAQKFQELREHNAELLDSPTAAVRRQLVTEVKEEGAEDDRKLRFVISSGALDRQGDTVNPLGWKTENFEKNPVVLFAHDYRQPPVARASDIVATKTTGRLKATAEFMSPDLYPFSDMLYRMYKEGFMKAVSVGFRPIKWKFADEDDEDRGFMDINFEEQELLEFSAVPVPANPEALVGAKRMGIELSPLVEWTEETLDNWEKHKETGLVLPRDQVEEIYQEASKMAGKGKKAPARQKDEDTTGDEELDQMVDDLSAKGGDDEAALQTFEDAKSFVKEFILGEVDEDELDTDLEELHAQAAKLYEAEDKVIPQVRHLRGKVAREFPEVFDFDEESGQLNLKVPYEDHEDLSGNEAAKDSEADSTRQELDTDKDADGGEASETGAKDDEGDGEAAKDGKGEGDDDTENKSDSEPEGQEELVRQLTDSIMEGVTEAISRTENNLREQIDQLNKRVDLLEQEEDDSDEELTFTPEEVSAAVESQIEKFVNNRTGKLS